MDQTSTLVEVGKKTTAAGYFAKKELMFGGLSRNGLARQAGGLGSIEAKAMARNGGTQAVGGGRCRGKIRFENAFNLCSDCWVGSIRAECDGLSTWRHMKFDGDSRAEAQVSFRGDEAICVLQKDIC